jgi:hypothetical protein
MSNAIVPNREVIKLFWDVRRKVKSEFGINLQLSDSDLMASIEECLQKTEDRQLLTAGSKLLARLEVLHVAVLSEPSNDALMAARAAQQADQRKVRYYRGQRVVV